MIWHQWKIPHPTSQVINIAGTALMCTRYVSNRSEFHGQTGVLSPKIPYSVVTNILTSYKKHFWSQTFEVNVLLKISSAWGSKPNANSTIQFGANHQTVFNCLCSFWICTWNWEIRAILFATCWQSWQNGNGNATKLRGRRWEPGHTPRDTTASLSNALLWRWPCLSPSGWPGTVLSSNSRTLVCF